MAGVLRKSSDYEERVLHFAQTVGREFCIQEAAEQTKLSGTTVAGIVSKFELVGLIKCQPLYPAQHFIYAPTAAALALPAVRRLFAYSSAIKDARKRRVARDAEYNRTRP